MTECVLTFFYLRSCAPTCCARARLAVRPGDSIPNRCTRPGTQCCLGPCTTKSPAGWPGPATCNHAELSSVSAKGRPLPSLVPPTAQSIFSPPALHRQHSAHLGPHPRVGWLQCSIGEVGQVGANGCIRRLRPCDVHAVVDGSRLCAWEQPALAPVCATCDAPEYGAAGGCEALLNSKPQRSTACVNRSSTARSPRHIRRIDSPLTTPHQAQTARPQTGRQSSACPAQRCPGQAEGTPGG